MSILINPEILSKKCNNPVIGYENSLIILEELSL